MVNQLNNGLAGQRAMNKFQILDFSFF